MPELDRRTLLAVAAAAMQAVPAGASARTPGAPAKTVSVGGVTLGEGRCKTIVSITERDVASARAAAQRLGAQAAIDIVELRVDHLDASIGMAEVARLSASLRAVLNGKPLLVTFRSKAEGGERAIENDAYAAFYETILGDGRPDLLDVEMARVAGPVRNVLQTARARGVPVIMSNHDFGGTPAEMEIVARLRRMQKLGADIIKIAVMPHDTGDLLTLLRATWTMKSRYADRPMVTMSMGGVGAVSRLCGEAFGSCATFGAVGHPSAPGQIAVGELSHALDMVHASLIAA